STDTTGAGKTPGFVHDPVQTPNSFNDNMFTGGGSKDTSGITQWQWKTQQPQDKDDIAAAFRVTAAHGVSRDTPAVAGMDRYSAGANSTVGFWFFQNKISVNANGTFSGTHTDGDVLLVVDFSVSGTSTNVGAYRWTGTDASGTLVRVTPPAGSTYLFVNTGPMPVTWTFIDKSGFTLPQAGEFLKVGLDLTAVFGANVPHFVSFLTETRSSTSTAATLSDFALGGVNNIGTIYMVKPGQYANTVTVTGVDQGTKTAVIANDVNYHFGVSGGPQLAVG